MFSFFALFIPCLAILGVATQFARQGSWPLSQAIFAAVSLIAVLQFLFAVADVIQFATPILLLLGCLLFVYALCLRDRKLYLQTQTLVYFFLGVMFIALFAWGLRFRSIDDYSFWGVMSKHLFLMNRLPMDDSIISANFLSYVPGMASFHYLFYFATGQYSQFVGYIAQGVVLLAALLVLFQADALRDSLLKTALAYILLSIGFGTVFARMEVDAYVAAYVFASAWLIVTRAAKPASLLFFPLLFLSLIKEIGFFFALLMIALLWLTEKKSRKMLLLLLLSLCALKWLWLAHCQQYGLVSFAQAIRLPLALDALNPWNAYFQPAQRLFLQGVLLGRFGHVLSWPNIISYVLLGYIWNKLNAGVVVRYPRLSPYRDLTTVNYLFCIGLLLYLVMLYLLQAVVFNVGHATDHLLDFQRYFNMLLIPFALITLLLYYQEALMDKQPLSFAIVIIAAVFIVSGKIERSRRYFMPDIIYPMVASVSDQLPKQGNWSLCLQNPPQPDYLLVLPLKYFFLPHIIAVDSNNNNCDYVMKWLGDDTSLRKIKIGRNSPGFARNAGPRPSN